MYLIIYKKKKKIQITEKEVYSKVFVNTLKRLNKNCIAFYFPYYEFLIIYIQTCVLRFHFKNHFYSKYFN